MRSMQEIREAMDSKRNGVRLGDIVLAALCEDTRKVMDSWTLYSEPVNQAPVNVPDDFFRSLKG